MTDIWSLNQVPGRALYREVEEVNYRGTDDPRTAIALAVPKEPGEGGLPVVVFIHGGGLTCGEYEIPPLLLNGRYLVAMVQYRLCPANSPLVALDDAAAAIHWVYEHAEEYGGSKRKLFVGGMSAGAYLAALVTMAPQYLAKYGMDHKALAGIFPVSGQLSTHFQFKIERGYPGPNQAVVIDEYAPMHYLSKDLPPVILITGESGLDIPGRPEENALAAATLKALGHPDVRHHALSGHPHGKAIVDGCGWLLRQFIDRLTGVEA